MALLKKSVTAPSEPGGDGLKGFIARSISSGLYVGYAPGAQGTLGSLWGPILCLLLPASWLHGLWLLIPAFFLLGVWASAVSEKYWGHDPGRIVFDEAVGAVTALAFIPVSVAAAWTGFFLFRALDILKPPPIRRFEKLPHGWGVMGDDLIAGLVSNMLLRIIIFFYPGIV